MPVSQQGSINTTALIVPDLYVQIVPPSVTLLNGLPTNILGVVGTATWGPTNAPTVIGSMASYAQQFGQIQARKYDMGTALAAAVLQGANNFRCIRVTDGTDVAASIIAQVTCITFTSKYTGTLGNQAQVIVSAGSQANTFKATVTMPGVVPEAFDNIPGTANALWVNMASAINTGAYNLRGPSQYIVATAGAGITAPLLATYSLAGGTDGATTITGAVLVGVDTLPRKGMYALRNTNTSIAMLADCDDSTTFSLQVAYGYSEGTYMVGVTPAGDTIANAATVKSTAGIDAYIFKYLFGDWIYFNDTVNNQVRLISPQGFIAGRLANLSPEQSSLNKPLYGIVGTQKSYQNLAYSSAELSLLGQAGIDLITNPIPAGNSFGARFGHNSSSNAVTNGDNYTRMTNYIAYTLNGGMGLFVGQLQSATVRRQAASTISAFLEGMSGQNMIGSADGTQPYSVQIDNANNPQNRVALGYLQADVKVRYLSVIEKFIINVEGGQSVVINRQSVALA
ncbi:phage tail protein [Glaciimonas sp. PCH181]|uniref:phage tail protein n=1 Tax=Glaciimonas sp. PCH181 TaxID=2133943 RepID=UPI000D386D6F|nr:phage tail protein [Glaciimonas sp. PCH181]PUA19582.1 phage tail protein [Glaciimonas sp. PCH181]